MTYKQVEAKTSPIQCLVKIVSLGDLRARWAGCESPRRGDAGTSLRSGDEADGPPPPQSTQRNNLDEALAAERRKNVAHRRKPWETEPLVRFKPRSGERTGGDDQRHLDSPARSIAAPRLESVGLPRPTAHAVGYILSPLRGWIADCHSCVITLPTAPKRRLGASNEPPCTSLILKHGTG
jgi:hypothetical protein